MTLPDAEVTHRRPSPAAVAVAVLSLAVFMSSLDLFIVNLAFPYMGRDFGSNLAGLSWVLNAYSIIFAATLVPAGRWADLIGRRKLFIGGLILFSVGSALCGLSPGVATLVAARVVQAIGAGMMVPTSLSLLLAVVPARDRARAIGTWSAIGALGAGMGPVVGGLLVQLNWRLVFWVNVPVGVLALLLARRALPESADPDSVHGPDVAGAVGIALAVGAIALGLVEAPTWGWSSIRVVGLFVAAVIAIGLVLANSARHPAPIIDLHLLRNASFSGAFVASVIYYAGFGAFVLNSVEFLTGEWHYSAIRAGLAIAPGPLCVLPFARVVAPRLAPVIGGAGRVAVLGAVVNAGAQGIWLASMTSTPSYASHLLPAQLIGGAGVGLVIPSLLGAGTSAVPAAWFGTASGVLSMARQVGTVLGVAGLVGLLAHPSATDSLAVYRHGVLLVIAFFAATALVAGGLLSRRVLATQPNSVSDRTLPSGSANQATLSPPGVVQIPEAS